MEIIISEEIQKKLITESLMGDLSKVLANLIKTSKQNLVDTQKIMMFDLKFLLTWSSTIAGFIGPLNDFVSDKNPELSQSEINFISVGVCSILLYNNEKFITEFISKVKEKGLITTLESALEKGKELRSALINFLKSIGVSASNVLSIASFTFMIPILSILNGYATSGIITPDNLEEIAERIALSGITALSAVSLRNFLKKVFLRINPDGVDE
jgi:hypothetical protein